MSGAVMLIAGAVIHLPYPILGLTVFAIGSVAFGTMQMLQRYEGRNFVINRLRRQQMLGATAFMIAACLMCMNTFRIGFAQGNEWVVAMSIGCVLELYTALRLPAELEKEKK
ncbi:MAG: hypothetical protein J5486_03610 [Bacteroidaceae bacterium]|nr:hypothetical protein [Bacteroidaceae bacterium]